MDARLDGLVGWMMEFPGQRCWSCHRTQYPAGGSICRLDLYASMLERTVRSRRRRRRHSWQASETSRKVAEFGQMEPMTLRSASFFINCWKRNQRTNGCFCAPSTARSFFLWQKQRALENSNTAKLVWMSAKKTCATTFVRPQNCLLLLNQQRDLRWKPHAYYSCLFMPRHESQILISLANWKIQNAIGLL